MQSVDFHAHLLNPDVRFDRPFDRVVIALFGKRLGLDPKAIAVDPYRAYTDALIRNIKTSKYLTQTVLFSVDAKCDTFGNETHKDRTICSDNDAVLALYQQHPDLIIPFFSINPLRKDALDLIDRYVALGFRGAKFLQNYWGVNLNQSRFIPYYDKLKAYNLPLIIHIGSESSTPTVKACESIEMLNLPLSRGVKVVAAHMGITYSFLTILKDLSTHPSHFHPDYFKLLRMLERYPNLYADISAILTPMRAKVLQDLSARYPLHEKILFATDFPVPFTILYNTIDLPFKRRLEIAKISNPYDRYIEVMIDYFGKESVIFSNYQKLI